MTRVLLAYGTRPEAIKLAPLIPELRDRGIEPVVVVTGQHRAMLDQVHELFGITADVDLDLGRPGQSPTSIVAAAVTAIDDCLARFEPDAVVVQGDTSSTLAAALASFYARRPVVHVEAGLRTGERYSPFPEEMNRRLTTQIANLHLAPTPRSRDNLLREGVDPNTVVVTGNTVIDALLFVAANSAILSAELAGFVPRFERTVLLTTHRRESWGERMGRSVAGVRRLAEDNPAIGFIVPIHLNPVVRQVVEPGLADLPNVLLTDPLGYSEFVAVMSASSLVITDSGGVQEEAPSLGKPVLVLRDDTERPEAVIAGTVRLVGGDGRMLYEVAQELLHNGAAYTEMAKAVNPYGDGLAASRSVSAIAEFLGVGSREPDFMMSDSRWG